MCVTFGRVEEDVADTCAGDVLLLGRDIGEEDAGRNFGAGPFLCDSAEIFLAEVGEAEEPEAGVWDFSDDAEPCSERCWLNLPDNNHQYSSVTLSHEYSLRTL